MPEFEGRVGTDARDDDVGGREDGLRDVCGVSDVAGDNGQVGLDGGRCD